MQVNAKAKAAAKNAQDHWVCPHCKFDFGTIIEKQKVARIFINTHPWFKGHVKICRGKSELERAYWQQVREWPTVAGLARLKRDGLAATLARREKFKLQAAEAKARE